MKKFPSKIKLREIEVRNPYELTRLGKERLFISWTPQETGRLARCAMYQVIHLDHKTDPKGHWQDYGNKTFSVWGAKNKEQALAEAIAWADEKYGKHEWIRTPWGDYVDMSCLQPAIDAVKALKKT